MSTATAGGRPVSTASPASRLGGPFWKLFAASSTSNLSDGVLQAALPLLAATLTRNPVAVSLLASLAFLPWLLFAVVSGALVDRVNRRAAMCAINLIRAGALAAFAVVVSSGGARIWLLYLVAFVIGCTDTVYDNASRALLPAVVDRSGLERGNSLLAAAESVGTIFLGAPVGAWLFVVGAAFPFWMNAAAYAAAGLAILTVAGSFGPGRRLRTSLRQDMVEGLRWLAGHRLLRTLMITTGVSALAQSMSNGIAVLFALQNLHTAARGFGLLLAIGGIGAVIGSILSPRLTALLGRVPAMAVSSLLGSVAWVALGLQTTMIGGAICFAAGAGGVSAFNVQIVSLRQVLVPPNLFGRVQGAYRTVIWGGIPVGSVLGGALGAALGLPAVFVISGAVGTLAGVAGWLVLQRHRRLVDEAFRTPLPVDDVYVTPSSGDDL